MVLRYTPLVWRCSICTVFWMGPKECVRSIRCLAKFEFWLFVLNADLSSLNLVKKILRFAPHMPYFSLGMLVYIHRIVCICLLCLLTVYCV